MFLIYFNIYKVDCKQQEIIKLNTTDVSTLYLPALPLTEYLHGANPVDDVFSYRFKNYYGINQNTKLIFTYDTFE